MRQVQGEEHSPLAFDVCSEQEAKSMDNEEVSKERKSASDDLKLSAPRASEKKDEPSVKPAKKGK